MNRFNIIEKIGKIYMTSNIEGGEYSYVQAAGTKEKLIKRLGKVPTHFKLDIRFQKDDVVVLVETKQKISANDEKQLAEYVEEEKKVNNTTKIIAILASTIEDDIKVWINSIDKNALLKNEVILEKMEHYIKYFEPRTQNDRETVLKNTYALNELLHKKDIDENLRSQFVGTSLLYIKDLVNKNGIKIIDNKAKEKLVNQWKIQDSSVIRAGIQSTLSTLLDGSENKTKKIELLQKNVLNDQKVKKLSTDDWIEILSTILMNIYKYINADSSEGQDILNMFFIAFNKYTGKADKNQAFTPDHITEFMCRITEVDRTKVVLDATCGSGSFLVQAMVKELTDCRRGKTEEEAKILMEEVKRKHIYGIEIEEKAYGLATTNMLIHGDGNSNIRFDSIFNSKDFIKKANPDIILMNPPYNAKPINIPDYYKMTWKKEAKNGKEDPTKGFVFIRFLSDVIKEINDSLEKENKPRKEVKMAVLLPVSCAIGTSAIITEEKRKLLAYNTLEAVFTLPNEVFYPGASVSACCMVFTLGRPHVDINGFAKETFFGYFKEDGFKKKKNIGRIEQFDENNHSKWKEIENNWIQLYANKKEVDGLSAKAVVAADDEWLCEAYMKTDYSKLTQDDFQQTLNNYLAYLVKEGKVYES